MKHEDIKVGDKVHYAGHAKIENGIVKEIPEHTDKAVRVVYNCNNDWDRYSDYTSALTYLTDLHLGWVAKVNQA